MFRLPSVSIDQRTALTKYFANERILRELDANEITPVIPTHCPPLDWQTGVGGLPRGRIIECYGAESTGKCLTLDTFIPLPGRGITTLAEILKQFDLTDLAPQQHYPLPPAFEVSTLYGATEANAVYYAGDLPTTTLYTEHGHSLVGAQTHRILTLTPNGLLRWTHLKDARPGDVLIQSLIPSELCSADNVFSLPPNSDLEPTTQDLENPQFAALMGALATADLRHDALYLVTATALQRHFIVGLINQFKFHTPVFEPNNVRWTNFTGLARLTEFWARCARLAIHPNTLRSIRNAAPVYQQSWLSGIILLKGQWSHEHLELEISDPLLARTAQALAETFGVRFTLYPTVNTFGDLRTKLALRSRLDQQQAEKILLANLCLPKTWRRRYAPEEEELPSVVTQTLQQVNQVFATLYDDLLDVQDLSRENCAEAALRLREYDYSRTRVGQRLLSTLHLLSVETVSYDIVTGTQTTTPQPCYDLSVPIGQHYISNSLISHNSTLALYVCKMELEARPEAVCIYFDYERAVPPSYVQQVGLLPYKDRFYLLKPDTLQQAAKIITDLYEQKIFFSIAVIDSVAAATPQQMFSRDDEDDAPIALRARLWAEILDKWSKFGGDYGSTFILLNQARTKIITQRGVRPRQLPGAMGAELEDTPGGRAVKFYSSIRLRLEPSRIIQAKVFNPMTAETEEMPIANMVRAYTIKNKVGPPFRRANFFIEFGKGVDTVRTMLEVATARKFVQKSGRTVSITLPDGRTLSGQGELGLLEALRADVTSQQALEKMLQWDQADKLIATPLDYVSTDLEGNVTAIDSDDAEARLPDIIRKNITASLINQSPTLASKADLLGLITKEGKAYVYTPEGKASIRAANLTSMNEKIKGPDRQDLQLKVDKIVQLLTESQNQDIPPTQLVPNPIPTTPDISAPPEVSVNETPIQ